MSKSYLELQNQKEQLEERKAVNHRRMQANRTEREALLGEFDDSVVAGKDPERIEAKIRKLDRDYELLELQAQALAKANPKKHLAPYAEKVVEEGRKDMRKLHGRWELVKDKIKAAKKAYLNLVEEARSLHQEGDRLHEQISDAQSLLPPPIQYVSMPGESDVNPERLRGVIFWENEEIYKVFTGKEHRR